MHEKTLSIQHKGLLLPKGLFEDLSKMIQEARQGVVRTVNVTHISLYWNVGQRIRKDILHKKRAVYGTKILSTLSKELAKEYGVGFSVPNLSRMVRFAETFPEREVIAKLADKLSWSHFVELLGLEDDLQRQFYAEICFVEGWNVRVLRDKINGMLYERTALSKKPEEVIKKEIAVLRKTGIASPDLVFRDPYFLSFLGLKDAYSEKDLEAAILRELESFILELGVGFSFIARQKCITIDNEDYHIDLLFYNRVLKRLVAIDLKLGKFKAADKGQMELYLRWLAKNEMKSGEKSPAGLILCTGASEDHIEYMELNKGEIRVASYLTELPPKEVLERKLHDVITRSRAHFENEKKMLKKGHKKQQEKA
jgi:predicted nuclease of restriction endonuclease-like (RecB) superfamily